MWIPVIMKNFVQVFARNMQLVGKIVVAGGNYDLARTIVVNGAVPASRGDPKITIIARNGFYPFVQAKLQMIMLGDATVVFQCFESRGLRQSGRKRNIADLQQFRL